MYNSISMTRMASSIAYAMGAEAPRQADPAIPLVTDMVDEVLNGGKADRVLIYNPDCIGLWMYQKYTEDLAPVLHATQLALPIATVAPPGRRCALVLCTQVFRLTYMGSKVMSNR